MNPKYNIWAAPECSVFAGEVKSIRLGQVGLVPSDWPRLGRAKTAKGWTRWAKREMAIADFYNPLTRYRYKVAKAVYGDMGGM